VRVLRHPDHDHGVARHRFFHLAHDVGVKCGHFPGGFGGDLGCVEEGPFAHGASDVRFRARVALSFGCRGRRGSRLPPQEPVAAKRRRELLASDAQARIARSQRDRERVGDLSPTAPLEIVEDQDRAPVLVDPEQRAFDALELLPRGELLVRRRCRGAVPVALVGVNYPRLKARGLGYGSSR
jgi:hypothetical protein